jgi:AbrB family looped-hinge helix DNA binding protein
MERLRVRVRKKGQITLPQRIRNEWKVVEGSEIDIFPDGDQATIRPVKRTKIREEAGALGRAAKDEIDFAVLDPELISQYYSRKYRG